MADALGFNYGDVVQQAETIKSIRAQNALAASADARAGSADARAAAQEGRTVNDYNRLTTAQDDATKAAKTPVQALAVLDPGAASQLAAQFKAMDDAQLAAKNAEIDNLGKGLVTIIRDADPAAAYLRMKELLPISDEMKKTMPEAYDETWVKAALAQTSELDTMLAEVEAARVAEKKVTTDAAAADKTRAEDRTDTATKVTTDAAAAAATRKNALDVKKLDDAAAVATADTKRAEDRIDTATDADRSLANDKELEEFKARLKAENPDKSDGKTGTSGDAAIANSINNAAGRLFTANRDAAGNLVFESDEQARTALTIAARAASIYDANPGLVGGINEAVRLAAVELGVNFPKKNALNPDAAPTTSTTPPAGFIAD